MNSMQNERMTIDTRRARYSQRARRVLPVAVVAALAVSSLAIDAVLHASGAGSELAGETLPQPLGLIAALLVLLQAVMLWWRESWPRLTLVVVTVLDVGTAIVSSGQLSVGTIAEMFAAYTVWRLLGARRALFWLALAAIASAVATAVTLALGGVVPPEWIAPVALGRSALAFGLPAVAAEMVSSRARLLEALRDRAALAEREQERTAIDAVQQERALMARELHDIAAHHLSGIILGAQAAGALIATEPDRAHDYMRTVRDEAQRTLANLRQTVGLLRPDGAGELAPIPAIEQIAGLVDTLRESGAHIAFEQTGDPVVLGPIAEVAAYRMVQESLTNARLHAPGAACSVSVTYGTDSAVLVVSNVAPASISGRPVGAAGNGLLGMRERAALIGGTLTVGATPDGGWTNSLQIPYPENGAHDQQEENPS